MEYYTGNLKQRLSPLSLRESDKSRLAILLEELARSNEEKKILKCKLKGLDKENSTLCVRVEEMNLLQEEQKILKDEITYLKVTCKFLEGNNVSILKKCNELQLKLQESTNVQEKRLDNVLLERQNLMLKIQKLKYKVKQLQEMNERLCKEVESYKKSSNRKCDAAVQVPHENNISKKERKSAKESTAEGSKSNTISKIQLDRSKIRESNSSTMDEEMILTDLFFGRNSDYFISNGRKTILNDI